MTQMGIFNNKALRLLTGALDGLADRQSAISSNIANAETPGYQRRTSPFEEQLRSVAGTGTTKLAATKPGHIGRAAASRTSALGGAQTAQTLGARNDANTVNVEQEMTDLAETTIRYYAVADALKSKLGVLRGIIERA